MPNSWTDITVDIDNLAELKVVEYILRHTWGYQEYGIKKHITVDEFVRGRRRQDGARLDKGTGLSERAVRYGLQKAVVDRLIEEEVDASDRGRIKKYYSVRMQDELAADEGVEQDLQSGVQSLHPSLQSLPPRGAGVAPRTEKDTLERHSHSNIRKATSDVDNSTETTKQSRTQIADVRTEASQHDSPAPKHVLELDASSGMPTDDAGESVPLPEAITRWRDRQEATARQEVPSKDTGRRNGRQSTTGGLERINATLQRRRRQPRQVLAQDEAYQAIQAYLADFAKELADRAPLKSSTTRAYNLYKRSGLELPVFINQLYAARAIVKERTGSIRSRGEDSEAGLPVKHKAGYYFAVLEDLLGLSPGDDRGAGRREGDGTDDR